MSNFNIIVSNLGFCLDGDPWHSKFPVDNLIAGRGKNIDIVFKDLLRYQYNNNHESNNFFVLEAPHPYVKDIYADTINAHFVQHNKKIYVYDSLSGAPKDNDALRTYGEMLFEDYKEEINDTYLRINYSLKFAGMCALLDRFNARYVVLRESLTYTPLGDPLRTSTPLGGINQLVFTESMDNVILNHDKDPNNIYKKDGLYNAQAHAWYADYLEDYLKNTMDWEYE